MKIEDWTKVKINQIGEIITGSTPDTKNPNYWDGNIPFVSPADFKSSALVETTERKLTEQGAKQARLIPSGAIFVTCIGSIGGIAIAAHDCVTNQQINSVICNDCFNSSFVYFLLQGNLSKLKELAGMTTLPIINKTAFGNIEVFCPQLIKEQKTIAAVLSTIDRAIEQTEAIIAKQQRIKNGLMQDLLTKGIDKNGNIRSEETHEFKDSVIGRIPVEWNIEPIGNIASLQRGHDIREVDLMPGVYPVVASSGVIGFHNTGTSSSPNVVVGRKGSIGNVHYVDTDFWAHDTSLYVTNFFGNNEKYIYYLFSYLKLERFGTKSGSPSLNRNDVHPLKVPFPNAVEQGRISSMLSKFDTTIESIKCALSKLRQQKIGLMQDLLIGKVPVTPLLDRPST